MADAEAQALVKAADKDGNQGIDFGEFAQLWQALHGEDEVGSRDFIRISQTNEINLGHSSIPFTQSSLTKHKTFITIREKLELNLANWTPTTVDTSQKVN